MRTRPWPKRFQYPYELLATEPEADKALRILRGLRHWLSLKYKDTSVIELDGEQIILIHVRTARADGRLQPAADTTPEIHT